MQSESQNSPQPPAEAQSGAAVSSIPVVRLVGKTWDDHPRYEVSYNGEVAGHVEGENPTFERKTPGKRYVNARWQSRRRYWRVINRDGRRIIGALETLKRAAGWLKPNDQSNRRRTEDSEQP